MIKNLAIGFALGIVSYHMYLKYKKPCGCKGHESSVEAIEISEQGALSIDSSECDKAVKQIINERRTLMRMTEDAYKKMYAAEMKICMGTN